MEVCQMMYVSEHVTGFTPKIAMASATPEERKKVLSEYPVKAKGARSMRNDSEKGLQVCTCIYRR